jgi:alpha-L-rhamnosidase
LHDSNSSERQNSIYYILNPDKKWVELNTFNTMKQALKKSSFFTQTRIIFLYMWFHTTIKNRRMTNHKPFIISFPGYIVFMLLFLISSSCTENNSNPGRDSDLKVLDLKCEYATNPIGMDVLSPQLSWKIESEKRGTLQSAYQIEVADSPENLSIRDSIIWNSGKVNSAKSVGVAYEGPKLISRKLYYWHVMIWDFNGNSSSFSQPAFYEMGLLNQEDWKADWIGYPASWTGRVLYFRTTFSTTKPVQKARAYISGIGYYDLHINGRKVGDHVLDPGTTDYSKQVLYTTYDIIDFLEKKNAIGVSIGPGWYGMPKLRLQAEITYIDGTTEMITTAKNMNWQVTVGPIIKSSIYDGEYYDAREEKPGWDLATGKILNISRTNRWMNAVATNSPGGKMVSQKLEPIKIMDTIIPQDIKEPFSGIYVIDARQNLAGWASLKVKGKRGTEVSLKFAESLNMDGTVNQENLRVAEAKDTYILKGGEEEQWEPSFTYHGFRYIQIEGLPYLPQPGDIQIKVVRSSVGQTGKFKCSNELLNRIHYMVRSTEASNLHSIPTDCPQRDERMGWLNDMTVRIEQALYNFDLSRFYPKWIDDIADTQGSDGSITDTAPFLWGKRPADPVSASYLLLALKSYEFYGNERIIRQHYDGLKAWVNYLNSRTEDGIVNYTSWGDWSPPIEFGVNSGPVSKNTPGVLMSTGYLYYCSRIISKMARITGNKKDEVYYEKLAQKTAEVFNKKYWNEQSGGYGSNNQACNSFALFLGLVDNEKIPRVVENLAKDVENHNYHLTTGNLCTKYLLEMLTEHGHSDVAYKIAAQETYPSWGFMLANGATTLWERWEHETGGAMNSHNHPMMGSVGSWFYKYILGILPDINGPGFEKFIIHPIIMHDLNFAEGEFNSIKGIIKSSWRKEPGSINFDVTIPGNSTATIYIPTKNINSITESNQKIDLLNELKYLRTEDKYAVYKVGSGTYHFKSDW